MKRELNDLRVIQDSNGVRIVFEWPEGEAYVRVVRVPAIQSVTQRDRLTAEAQVPAPTGSMLTQAEYKQHGGYLPPREAGRFTFQFPPYANRLTCVTGQVHIQAQLRQKWGMGAQRTYIMKLHTDGFVPPGTLGYKKAAAHHATIGDSHAGVVYSFDEPLQPGNTTRHILTNKNERIEFFLTEDADREIYTLHTQHE